jgi:hypothetical protein
MAGFLRLLAEPPTQEEVLAVHRFQGSLQLGDMLAVAAFQFGELPSVVGPPLSAAHSRSLAPVLCHWI